MKGKLLITMFITGLLAATVATAESGISDSEIASAMENPSSEMTAANTHSSDFSDILQDNEGSSIDTATIDDND